MIYKIVLQLLTIVIPVLLTLNKIPCKIWLIRKWGAEIYVKMETKTIIQKEERGLRLCR